MDRKFLGVASTYMLLAVIAGAFGAHGLKPHLSEAQLGNWHTGVSYQFYHALAILVLSIGGGLLPTKHIRLACMLFSFGIILFSGSLYLLSIRDTFSTISTKILGPTTPIGGLLFIAGWIVIIHAALWKSSHRSS